jgi:hypothetical protein
MTPAYVFPVFNVQDSAYTDFERRVYEDRVVITFTLPDTAVSVPESAAESQFLRNHPNPFYGATIIEYSLPETLHPVIYITDATGKQVRKLNGEMRDGNMGEITWDGRDDNGNRMAPGIYYYSVDTGSGKRISQSMLLLDHE